MTDITSENLDQAIEEGGSAIVRRGLEPGDAVLVTGAARGFGRAIAKRLADEGARLALWDFLDDEGEETGRRTAQESARAARGRSGMSRRRRRLRCAGRRGS